MIGPSPETGMATALGTVEVLLDPSSEDWMTEYSPSSGLMRTVVEVASHPVMPYSPYSA
ncbi:hypothetical protein QE454_002308 [Microbacterium sp. SORGH_AS454]|nr:hypothetical protein [Microbacterium sp. SORGH_AS_0454]